MVGQSPTYPPLPIGAPTADGYYVLDVSGGTASWHAGGGGGGFTPGGDLSGSSSSQTVIGVQGNPVQSGTLGAGQDGYVLTWVSGASLLEFRSLTYTNIAGTINTNGFRLTLTSGTPVTTTDVMGAGILYCTPMMSGQIGLFVGGTWTMITSPEVLLVLSITSGKNYDVFAYSVVNSGVLSLELSSAWTNNTTRNDAISQQNGVWVKNTDPSRRYLGTIRATGTNTTEDSVQNRFLYNFYNQQKRPLLVTDNTNNWNSPIGGWHQARGTTTNNYSYVSGMSYEVLETKVMACQSGNNTSNNSVGVGLDSSTVNSAQLFGSGAQTVGALPVLAFYEGSPGLGYHNIVWLEWIGTAGQFYGDANGLTNQIAGMSGRMIG